MHYEVRQFIKRVRNEFPHKFRLRDVIECGSKNINGSPRRYFWFCNYTGVDLSKGRGVDVVGNFAEMNFGHDRYGVAICCEVLEHAKDWEKILEKMYLILESGGLFIMTCASVERAEHGTTRTTPAASPDTTDYYRNISKEDFRRVLPEELFKPSYYVLMNARDKQDLFFYGIKK